jgi:hypothetical protein
VQALVTEYCLPYTPIQYLAEPNTPRGCPVYYQPPIAAKELAEEVTVRLSASAKPLTIHFTKWDCTTDCTRTLTVSPVGGDGIRVELSNQMMKAAAEIDSTVENSNLCGESDYRDYLWYYDLRSPGIACSDFAPAYFPCDKEGLGGTKCPEHDWGP